MDSMVTSFLLLLLPIAAASGWMAAKRISYLDPKDAKQNNDNRFVQDYLVGLNYLLNEQPDKAVDAFIKMLEVDDETVETHLALGALFRRRGEVDRAIRIHQNLIARPQLPKRQRMEALLALGQDYLKAGVLDRAERLFLEIIEANDEYKISALSFLLDIYQQQKRWEAAIPIANQLMQSGAEVQAQIAHYYCELAIIMRLQNKNDLARDYLQKALAIDNHCARASLLLGALELEQENLPIALENYQQVKKQNRDFFHEALTPIARCFERLGQTSEVVNYFKSCLEEQPQVSIVLLLVELIKNQEGNVAAIDFLTKQLRRNPSVRGLHRLITLHLEMVDENAKESLLMLQDAVLRLLRGKLHYHCEHCGFASKVLHWLCPGCKRWGSVKPVES